MRAARIQAFVLGTFLLGTTSCVNLHISERYGIPERRLFDRQVKRARSKTATPVRGDEAEKAIELHYATLGIPYEKALKKACSGGGGSAGAGVSRSAARSGLIMRSR